MADIDEDDATTRQIRVNEWLEPVSSALALPKVAVNEGAYCYVQENGDEATWQYRRGRWVRLGRRPR